MCIERFRKQNSKRENGGHLTLKTCKQARTPSHAHTCIPSHTPTHVYPTTHPHPHAHTPTPHTHARTHARMPRLQIRHEAIAIKSSQGKSGSFFEAILKQILGNYWHLFKPKFGKAESCE